MTVFIGIASADQCDDDSNRKFTRSIREHSFFLVATGWPIALKKKRFIVNIINLLEQTSYFPI